MKYFLIVAVLFCAVGTTLAQEDGFTRNKIVVMSATGEILEMFLDDPVNRSSWIA